MADVFCGKCTFFKMCDYATRGTDECRAKSNTFINRDYRIEWVDYRLSPRGINRNNNCKQFEPKWWARGRRQWNIKT